jgi:hypothetical protein
LPKTADLCKMSNFNFRLLYTYMYRFQNIIDCCNMIFRDMMYSNVQTEDQCNGFNGIWFILLKQTQHYFTIILHTITLVKIFFKKSCSLCSRWSFLVTPDLPCLLLPSSCCLLPRWALTAYLLCFLGGRALPHSLPQADPISLRSQATPRFHVRHNDVQNIVNIYPMSLVLLFTTMWFFLRHQKL